MLQCAKYKSGFANLIAAGYGFMNPSSEWLPYLDKENSLHLFFILCEIDIPIAKVRRAQFGSTGGCATYSLLPIFLGLDHFLL